MTASTSRDPFVAIVLLTFDQREKTLRCLESLAGVEGPRHATVVWDNGSVDGTAEALARSFPAVTVYRSPRNLGAAAGRNRAARQAIDRFGPTHLLFLDNDTIVAPDLLQKLVEPTLADPTIAQTAPKIRLLGDPDRLEMAGGARIRYWLGEAKGIGRGEIDRGQYDEACDCIAGGCTLVNVEAFERIGGFDTGFDPYGYEDMDFSLRLVEAGYRCRYVPEAVLFHEITRTFEGGGDSPRFARVKARNLLRFQQRHASIGQRLAFLAVGAPLALARQLLRGRPLMGRGFFEGAIDFAKSRLPRGNSQP